MAPIITNFFVEFHLFLLIEQVSWLPDSHHAFSSDNLATSVYFSCKSVGIVVVGNLASRWIIDTSFSDLASSYVPPRFQQQPLHDFLFFHFFFQQEPLLRFAFQLLLRFDSIYCGGIMLLVPQYECTRVAKCLIRSSSSPMVLVDSDACLDSIRSIALFL